MQNNKTMPEISGIPLLKWHLPNKDQDLTTNTENKKLKNENNNFLSKNESISFKCNTRSSSCPTDSEFTEPNEENSEIMETNIKQERDYLSDEITKIGERLNYSLRVRNSNNDSTQSQKGSYNLRKRDKNIEFTGTQSRKSTSAQQLKKRVAKRKLPPDFSEEIICFKKGRKRENASIGDSQVLGQSTNSTAQKLKRQFFKTETTLNEINQLILNWIRGTSKPLQRDEALTILETVKSTTLTLRDNQRTIKIDETLECKKPLQLYANKLQKDCEKLLKKMLVIIYECDIKHSEFTVECENKNESLPTTVSTEYKKNLHANKKPTKTIKSMITKTKNHFKKLSFSKKIINTHDKDILSHRSLYLDQYKYAGDVHQNTNDMDVEETDCTNDFIDDNISDKVKDFNLTEKFIVHDSELSVETEMRDLNVVEQNLLNKEIISAVEKQRPNINISKQLTQNFSDSQVNNSENTNEQVANNPQNYLRNDQNVQLLINMKQVGQSVLKGQESTNLHGNSKKQSQRKKQKQNRKKTDSETQKPIENVEIQAKQAKANSNDKTSKIEKARTINGESEVPQPYPFSVNCSSVQRNHKVGSQNFSKTYIHPAMGENSKNNTDLEIYNNTTVNLNNFQVQKKNEVIKEVKLKLLTQESLPTENIQMTPISKTKPDVLNPLEYLRNDVRTRYSIDDNNLKQTGKSILKIIHQPENTQLYSNNSEQSQHLANVERMKNISLQVRSYLEPQKFSENVEILSKQIKNHLNVITVPKQTPGRINEKLEAWQKNSLPNNNGLETSSIHSTSGSCGMNISKTYIQSSNDENLENSTKEVVNNNNNNNKMSYVNICQVPKQKTNNKTKEFLTPHFLVTNGLDTTSQTTDSTARDIQVTKSYNLKPSTVSSEKTFIVHPSQLEEQERAKAEIGPLLQDVLNITSSEATSKNTEPIVGNLNFSEILTHPAINNTFEYNLNPLLVNNKNNLNNNTPNDKLKPNQIQNHTKTSNVNSLQMNPINVVGTQRNPYPNSISIIPSIKQKSFIKIQAEEEGLLRRPINITNKIKDISQDEASLESNQHRQNNAEQHSNFANNGNAKRSTNFKTYKRKKINKEVSNEIRSEISQQSYQGVPLTVIQANNEITTQPAALEKTNHITTRDYDKSMNSKNDLKNIIDDSALEQMYSMETFSCLSLPAPTFSISQSLKVSNNSETDLVQKSSTDLKTTSNCLRSDLADVIVRPTSMEFKKDTPKVPSSDINQNNQTTDINPNKHIVDSIVMEIRQDKKIEMKNKESQTCFATLLLNSDASSNVVSQEKIQSPFSSDTITTTFEGIKSMRIKSKDEFVIIQDLKDLITADEFIW
ncbi:uncharacterized protein isoform X2 [Rhodnius prolixus]|uniref:uncharacterized protein isoform X2 n=1 Tax=Rhodnius prolixus TaxID=13249 RepID=UPI003D18AFB9